MGVVEKASAEAAQDAKAKARDVYNGLWAKQSADIDDRERNEDIGAIAHAILVEAAAREYAIRWANKAVDDVKSSFAGAMWDIRAERQRQVDDEGWTAAHDDTHTAGEMAQAAAAYALKARSDEAHARALEIKSARAEPFLWPATWSVSWWKPTNRRRDLVKAGALIVAEIERLDRISKDSPSQSSSEGK
jgi:hypothetical protein